MKDKGRKCRGTTQEEEEEEEEEEKEEEGKEETRGKRFFFRSRAFAENKFVCTYVMHCKKLQIFVHKIETKRKRTSCKVHF